MVIQSNRWHRRILALRTRPVLVEHLVRAQRWRGRDIRIAVLSDFHVVGPYSSLQMMRRIGEAVMQMRPDMIVLAGDFLGDGAVRGRHANARDIADAMCDLSAPGGVFAILGNHDWKDCPLARRTNYRENSVQHAFKGSNVTLLRNESQAVELGGEVFNVVGFDSQRPVPRDMTRGLHDPELAFSSIQPDRFTLLLAHEPDYFAQADRRADLQISAHTHGGQLNLFGWRPIVLSKYGARFAHGHFQDGKRQMVVSAGLGFSGVPMRIGQPAEVTMITLQSSSC